MLMAYRPPETEPRSMDTSAKLVFPIFARWRYSKTAKLHVGVLATIAIQSLVLFLALGQHFRAYLSLNTN